MDSLITLLTTLVWPLTILVIAVVFRTQLVFMLGRLSSLKYGEFEVGFDQELRRAEADARAHPQVAAATAKPSGTSGVIKESAAGPRAGSGDFEALYRQAILTPRAAISEAWQRVEKALCDSARTVGGADGASVLGYERAARLLADRGELGPDLRARIDRLRVLQEWAARGPELESPRFADHARRYIDLTREVIAPLNALARRT